MKKTIFLSVLIFLIASQSIIAQQIVAMKADTKPSGITISKHIYGHFSEHLGRCIYDGLWVDTALNVPKEGRIRMDVVNALKKIKIPNLRWPGGCFADEYHWRDGIGPLNQRPKMVNTNWGGVTEDNSFGTHEFLRVCELLETEPYIAGNVGSGTVQEMAQWVEYLNFDGISPMADQRRKNGRDKPWNVLFWGVGNESWGCGGNMTAEFYADQYKRYATYARNYPGANLKKIASGASDYNTHWTEVMMSKVPAGQMWGLSLHYYTIPTGNWEHKGSATQFDAKEYITTMKNCLAMDDIITRHSAVMDKYDPAGKVALVVDEWGTWTDVEPGTNPGFLYQQNSMRDALMAASTLNIFNNHAGRVKMANLAQAINVLQALILTDKEKMLLTPTYHVFDLFKDHMDARLVRLSFSSPRYVSAGIDLPALNASASIDANNELHISLVNIHPSDKIHIRASLAGFGGNSVTGKMLTSGRYNDVNSFSDPVKVTVKPFNGAHKKADTLDVELPPLSVVLLSVK